MLAAVNIILLVAITAWIWKRDTSPLRKFYWPALLMKCVAGIALGIIYSTYYESSDTFTFFKLATDQAEFARTDFGGYLKFLFREREGYFLGEHRTIFYTKITSVLALLTGDHYWIVSIYYSLISFFAAWYLTNTLARLFPEYKIAACIAFLFFPSVVFWSSGVIKESLAMAGMYFLTALFLKLWVRERISILVIVLAILCAIIIFNLKYYYLAAFIPITLASLVARGLSSKFGIKRFAGQALLWLAILIVGFIAVTFLHPNFSPSKILQVVTYNNKIFMDACTPDDVIHFYKLEPTWSSMFINAPWAFVSGLFRPFVWESNTIFKFVTGLENLVLLILAVLSISSLKRAMLSTNRLLILATILYTGVLSIFLALSTPNFGTLARYGVGYLPFVVLLLFNQPFISKVLARFF